MNYKGLKDQVFNCQNCYNEFGFKGYAGVYHKYCSTKCTGEHRAKLKAQANALKFEQGKLTHRRAIYKLLVDRDGNKCSVCEITEWVGQPIRLWVDHIDGNATNNTPSNFRLVCPNCDSQSKTFGGKNRGSGRRSRGLKPYG
jgi:hypothetical protein